MFPQLAMLALLSVATVAAAQELWEPLIGSWRFLDPRTVDDTGGGEFIQLDLDLNGGVITGVYFGINFQGERSPYYTVARASSVTLAGDGFLSVTVPGRKVFAVRPASFEEAESVLGYGYTRSEIRLAGSLQQGLLVLECTSNVGVCPATVMRFHRSTGGL